MYSAKIVKTILMAFLLVLTVYKIYPNVYYGNNDLIKYNQERLIQVYNGSEDYLIKTPGCNIPNYVKTMKFKEANLAHKTCGVRAVFIKKILNSQIVFIIDNTKMMKYTRKKYSCCYQFVSPSISLGKKDYTSLRYSKCEDFINSTKTELIDEIITITCTLTAARKSVIYKDAYAILKTHKRKDLKNENSWNVLILGMDTMSRARTYNSMPKTTDYMLKHNWLDYRGYQKVGYNTFPNVMSLLTGENTSKVYKACVPTMDNCNHMIIWSEFQKAGYVTATGEDYLSLPDTFGKLKYKSSPTDHYLRPLFLTGEDSRGNLVCTKKMSSTNHILDYATSFADTYKDDKFFGMFWFNSYSHNLVNVPQLIDHDIVKFFNNLHDSGVLNRTFIFFLSDHGMRYGDSRKLYESYYEERLPMLFLWVPYDFRRMYINEYKNLIINQNRLITPYDLHLTLWDIIVKSKILVNKINAEDCPYCESIFKEISPYRNCTDAYVDEKWCTCHGMTSVDHKDIDAHQTVELVVNYLQDKMKNIKTTPCMKCIVLNLKKVLRIHTYRDESLKSTYYILAIVMTPGDVAYEATIVKRNGQLNIINPTYTISPYNIRGSCVVEPNHRSYCVCEKIAKCKIKH
ncbi:unnamed protein product [Euphydryas editha]|uniref:Uncharacterized protein n=1 Tax=Euphydryas editha TaxID=104508 RepID=A0AAU9TGE3_EUPED|nr:unnamed protein product [Euphydryas editha]